MDKKKKERIMLRILKPFIRKYIRANEEFQKQTQNPKKTQEKILFNRLRENKETLYGLKYNFKGILDSGDINNFQKYVPIIDYNDISELIEKEKNGEHNILTTQQPIRFVTTSGTTGKPKFIPITPNFIEEYINSWNIWIFNAVKDHLGIVGGKVISIVSPSKEGTTKCNLPYGAITGLSQERQSLISKLFYALPKNVCNIKDPQEKLYNILRLSAGKNISMLNTANPSTIKNLCLMGNENKEKLIEDIYDKGDKKRARKLEKIINQTGVLYPKDYWPDLACIGCWTAGTLSLYLKSFPEFFNNTPIRDLGLIASEGRFTIPITDNSKNGGILDIGSHFYEFIPESEINSKQPNTLNAWELMSGEKYFLIPTTSSGLYRYNINDLVEVTCFYNQTPMIKFLNKGKHISSLTGEKITEYQVVKAMEKTCEQHNLKIDNFLVSPIWSDNLPNYGLFLEKSEITKNRGKLISITNSFDENLQKLNIEYCSKRLDRLGNIKMGVIPKGIFEEIKNDKVKNSGRDTQYKHQFLNPAPDFHTTLNAELIN